MDIGPILTFLENFIWVGMAGSAGFGLYCVILLMRRVGQKRFPSAAAEQAFLEDVGDQLEQGNFEGVQQICDTPELWARAVPQLIQIAVLNRDLPIKKVRQLMGERFERDVLASMEQMAFWVATVVKTAPMLGLLGTVVGMINAFGKIAGAKDSGIEPSALAGDISFALFTTAAGLAIAIPLVVLGAAASVRMTKLQDTVQESLGVFLDDLEAAQARR
ncbi:MAG: MotA/TolQ/ExbB proton channel family protein [Planctomycetaceae bacterium]|nr:MotA/TolQ/ExbB proton channel family protein [Planctomycetaceae bacterium]